MSTKRNRVKCEICGLRAALSGQELCWLCEASYGQRNLEIEACDPWSVFRLRQRTVLCLTCGCHTYNEGGECGSCVGAREKAAALAASRAAALADFGAAA